jgi:plastocyanin
MMMRSWASLYATTTLLLAVAGAEAGPVSGVVTTRTAPGTSPAASLVYAEPLDSAAPRRPGHYMLAQRNRTFLPMVLAVPVGSTVEFPNRDPIFHNVFSLSAPQPFDLGLYRGGASKSVTFTQPGTYRVFCNIHPEMIAFIAVVPTPWLTQVDAEGRYSLDLPPGRYRLTALSNRAQPTSDEFTVAAGATIAPKLELDESNFVLLPHKDKYGHDYPRQAYEPAKR